MKKNHSEPLLLTLLLLIFLSSKSISAVDFVFNGFSSSNLSLYGTATLESRILALTNRTTFTIGRALYTSKIPTKRPNSSFVYPFSTSFIFAMAPYKGVLAGHGLVFLFVPFNGIQGATVSQNLGLLNRTNDGNSSNHLFGVEFDVFKNQEFNDIDENHMGIDVNSLNSETAHAAGYWPDDIKDSSSSSNSTNDDDEKLFKELKLNNGKNYQVWNDYADSFINVTMAEAGMKRPKRPFLSGPLNLSRVLKDEMYVGFTASTGQLVESHKILAWSFSNSNFSLSEELISSGLPSFVLPKDSVFSSKRFIAGVVVGGFLVIVAIVLFSLFMMIKRKQRKAREREEMEDWELEYWPHRITYQEIEAATKGFTEENVIGIGVNGKVDKGVLEGGAEVAVKRISPESDDGMRAFLAEVSSLGRLKHKSFVSLRGWCKREKGSFMLVYDYMENGSLDKWIFQCDESKTLSCDERIRILKDVAVGVLYLHEGWQKKVLHRDIKSSNVLLDKEMNGRLGDFGLARMHGHGQVARTTCVVGTVGYLAPEVISSGRASTETDVFGFGILVLEIMSGRRPIEEGKPNLVEMLWELMVQGRLFDGLDERLRVKGGFNEEEVERVVHLGLLCSYPDPSARPTMRQVVKVLDGKIEASENESEDLDAYLLQKVNPKEMWDNYSQSFGCGYATHPTFQDIGKSNSYSMSLSWSNTILEGR